MSLFTDPMWSGLFGDEEVQCAFSPETAFTQYIAFEVALTNALATHDLISDTAKAAVLAGCKNFIPDLEAYRVGVAKDGLPVPAFIKQLRACIDAPYTADCHKTSTSQDVMDTALALSLKQCNSIFQRRLLDLISVLEDLMVRSGARRLMGRTRMQAALPITVADRLATWLEPLRRHQQRLSVTTAKAAVLQYGGPVGTSFEQNERAGSIAAQMATELGLGIPQSGWQTQRDAIVEYANVLSLISGSLGKIGADIGLMAQQGIEEIKLSGGGGSSAMAHKHNPIKAELLVTLARYNSMQIAAMHSTLVHEQERSGSAWALEWMVLPGMCVVTGAGLQQALHLLKQIEWIGSPLSD